VKQHEAVLRSSGRQALERWISEVVNSGLYQPASISSSTLLILDVFALELLSYISSNYFIVLSVREEMLCKAVRNSRLVSMKTRGIPRSTRILMSENGYRALNGFG